MLKFRLPADMFASMKAYGRVAILNPIGEATVTASGPSPAATDAMVLVVDDEEAVRIALSSLFRSVGLKVEVFASASELLKFPLPDLPCCLLLDVRLRGPSGLELQTRLVHLKIDIPIIFLTGYGDIPMSVAAMKAGAENFIAKPARDQDLLEAVAVALEKDILRRASLSQVASTRARYATLSPREAEVMQLAVMGLLNKQIAGKIGISEVTVKIHRGRAMRKITAARFADLIAMAQQLGLRTAGT